MNSTSFPAEDARICDKPPVSRRWPADRLSGNPGGTTFATSVGGTSHRPSGPLFSDRRDGAVALTPRPRKAVRERAESPPIVHGM